MSGMRPPGLSTPRPEQYMQRVIEEQEADPVGAARGDIIAETMQNDIQTLTTVRKEADRVTVPVFPTILNLPKWRLEVFTAVASASGRRDDDATAWLSEAEKDKATFENLYVRSSEFGSLDKKLAQEA